MRLIRMQDKTWSLWPPLVVGGRASLVRPPSRHHQSCCLLQLAGRARPPAPLTNKSSPQFPQLERIVVGAGRRSFPSCCPRPASPGAAGRSHPSWPVRSNRQPPPLDVCHTCPGHLPAAHCRRPQARQLPLPSSGLQLDQLPYHSARR